MSVRSTMDQSSNKFAKIDDAIQNLELLQKSGRGQVNIITDVFSQMNSEIITLKSEKELLAREIQKNERRTPSHGLKDKNVYLNEASMQTETDEDGTSPSNILTTMACSVLLPPSSDDKYILIDKEQQKQFQLLQIKYEQVLKDKECLNAEIISLGNQLVKEKKTYRRNDEQEKDRIKYLEEEIRMLTEGVKNENEILKREKVELEQVNIDIRREMGEKVKRIAQQKNQVTELEQQVDESRTLLDQMFVECSPRFEQRNTDSVRIQGMFESEKKRLIEKVKQVNTIKKLENQIREYRTERANPIQQIEQKDRMLAEMEQKILQMENQYGKVIDERKNEIEKLTLELNHKETELNHLRRETEGSIKKIKNELSFVAAKLQNSKKENDELHQTISGQEDEISHLKLTVNKLKTDTLIKEANVTGERNKLRNEIAELQNKEISLRKDYATLVQNCLTLEKQIEKLTMKKQNKKYISFHCVLKQPQSDKATNGIVSLLQQKFEEVDIEIVPESKRSNNVPLLVVLYNLSKLTDDAKGALIGIEASSDVTLLVLHSKEIKKASDQVLTLPDFKKLGIIVDMSFISAKGLIHNELTANAVNQLAKYLNKY